MDSERFEPAASGRQNSLAAAASSKNAKPKEDACLYCPCCSSRLSELKCKLLCEKCGYFMSCADYH